jgi:polyisoprenoid-binding protein YceI
MGKHLLILIVFAILLVACSSQAATQAPLPVMAEPTAAVTSPTDAPLATEESAPLPAATEAPTSEPTAEAASPAAGLVTYKIIPGESQLQYEVGEVFIDENNRFAVAIGVTPQVAGEISLDLAAPQNSSLGTFTADISQFQSDSGRRDNAIRGRYLESERYPTVTFVPTSVEGLPESYQEGQDIPLKITGDLTIREKTLPATFDAVVRLEGNQLTGQATTTILMSDFEFGPISIAGILKTEDEAKITLKIVARP